MAKAAADIDDSIKRKRFRVSLKNYDWMNIVDQNFNGPNERNIVASLASARIVELLSIIFVYWMVTL